MFSGIVEDVGTVASLVSRGTGLVLGVSTGLPLEEIRVGDSLCVSGACLSVTGKEKGRFFSEVSAETLSRTTFRSISTGARVNLERSLSLSGRLDGHLVYGHVDGTGTVHEVRRAGESRVFHIRTDPSIMKCIVFKGAVALDGVSLTVSAVRPEGFEVTLIPLTLERTTFGRMRPGDAVNVETDVIGKYVLKYLEGRGSGISLDFLKKHGFA
ncbi:MAG TPA: riboflavin synthase [Candidatus Deferrimicrobiaceae bacterium]|nr:riboflavin synthase [Candidatus Deferrimicrobiaceae bacterium]